MTSLGRQLEAGLDALATLDLHLVAVAIGFQLANLVLRSLAWRNVLAAAYPERRISPVAVGSAYAAGVAANAVTPARGGELVKIALVRTALPGTAVATIAGSAAVLLVADAVLGGTLLAVAAAAGAIPGLELIPPPPSPWAVAAGVAVAVPLAVAGFFRARPLIGRVRHQLLRGGAILRQPRRYLRRVALLQLGAWSCRVAVVFALLCAFDLPADVPTAALVVVAGGASTLVPATPGGLGVQQLLLVAVLHGTATAAEAVSFSLVLQLGVSVLNVTIGLAGAMLILRTRDPRAVVRRLRAPAP